MAEGFSVREHLPKFMSNLNELEILGVEIFKESQVEMILQNLPDSSQQLRLNYNMNKMDMSLVELQTMRVEQKALNEGVKAEGSTSASRDREAKVEALKLPMLKGIRDAQEVENFLWNMENYFKCSQVAFMILLVISNANDDWTYNEIEIVEVVADQVVVALSRATVLEELMRKKLEARNGLLQQAKKNTVKASQTRNSFKKVMNNGMIRPMQSILSLLSILQD
ncbi:ethylene receptor 2-like [Solanum lycopersicum]|uniref:ethylene receptor 2-like n=1 Tax=Solanum lycopersicum TaxID=4081 RepID=UPI0002BCBE78